MRQRPQTFRNLSVCSIYEATGILPRNFLLCCCVLLFFAALAPRALGIIDIDQNMISDVFQKFYENPSAPHVFAPLDDDDADGVTNLLEAIAGTDPLSAQPPAGHFFGAISRSATSLTMRWPSVLGKQYTLLSSPNLAAESWTPVETARSGTGGEMQTVIPTAGLPGKLFYRVGVSDTDFNGDGITQWERLHLPPTATLSDYDGDGLLNTWEIAHNLDPEDATGVNGGAGDADGDGYSNSSEQAAGTDPRNALSKPGGPTTPPPAAPNSAFVPIARYALFPLTDIPTKPEYEYWTRYPSQINDLGTVLYDHGTWTGGVWLELAGTNFDPTHQTSKKFAVGISDTGMILGLGEEDLYGPSGNVMTAASPGDTLTHVTIESENIDEWSSGGSYPAYRGTLTTTNQVVGTTNYFTKNGIKSAVPVYDEGWEQIGGIDHTYIWTLPAGPRVSIPAGYSSAYDADHYWGYPAVYPAESKPTLKSMGATIELEELPEKFAPFDNDHFLLSYYKNGLAPGYTTSRESTVLHKNKLIGADQYKDAIDIALDGTAIGRNSQGHLCPIYQNNKWQDLYHTTPQFTNSPWRDGTVELLDTTAHGWILASRGTYPDYQYAAMLPLKVEPAEIIKPTGLDAVSITATDYGGNAVRDKIWLMAPKGGPVTEVKIKSPLNGQTPLKLSSQGVTFSPDTLTAASTTVSISAGNGAAPGDADCMLKFGTVESASVPIGIKIMKARELKITIHPVQHFGTNTPVHTPTKAFLDKELTDIFQPQINLKVNATLDSQSSFDYEDAQTNKTYVGPKTDAMVRALQYQSGKNIEVFLISQTSFVYQGIGGEIAIDGYTYNQPENNPMIPMPIRNKIIVNVWNESEAEIAHTIAHEIGHLLINEGHPDKGNGVASLPGTELFKRLMVSGSMSDTYVSRDLVKGEWDKADENLNKLITGQ
jgi:Bacterial TSP3 repeat